MQETGRADCAEPTCGPLCRAALSFAGLFFNPLRQSLITGGDSAYLLPYVRVMNTISPGKGLCGEHPPAACQVRHCRRASKCGIKPAVYHIKAGKSVGLPTHQPNDSRELDNFIIAD
jgi:hypothetical protein